MMIVPSHTRTSGAEDGARAAASSRASFEGFFAAERARLFGALIVMTDNRAEAEEILQDAFLTVWERWERVAAMEDGVIIVDLEDDPGGSLAHEEFLQTGGEIVDSFAFSSPS